MKTEIEIRDGTTFVSVNGKINSANADEFEKALSDTPGNTDSVIIDAYNLEYLSSAGLRVLLSLKKRCKEKGFRIINVNKEVMHIFDVTGFSEIMEIEAASREVSIEGCEVIGRGACGECYRIDDETIIKLYYQNMNSAMIEHEKILARKAFVMGIPTAISYDIVRASGRYGVIYELIDSKTLGECMRTEKTNLDEYIRMYSNICREVHSIHTDDPEIPSFKDINRADIVNITDITDEEREYLYRFLNLVPDSDTCIHGDLNINNIMVQKDECCLIDMGELSTGVPVFDISRIVFSMIYANTAPGEYNSFYKMPSEKVREICEKFLLYYFECDNLEDAAEIHPEMRWLHPMAWFRCCTSMLKGNCWPEEKRTLALKLLREKLIPFVDEESAKRDE